MNNRRTAIFDIDFKKCDILLDSQKWSEAVNQGNWGAIQDALQELENYNALTQGRTARPVFLSSVLEQQNETEAQLISRDGLGDQILYGRDESPKRYSSKSSPEAVIDNDHLGEYDPRNDRIVINSQKLTEVDKSGELKFGPGACMHTTTHEGLHALETDVQNGKYSPNPEQQQFVESLNPELLSQEALVENASTTKIEHLKPDLQVNGIRYGKGTVDEQLQQGFDFFSVKERAADYGAVGAVYEFFDDVQALPKSPDPQQVNKVKEGFEEYINEKGDVRRFDRTPSDLLETADGNTPISDSKVKNKMSVVDELIHQDYEKRFGVSTDDNTKSYEKDVSANHFTQESSSSPNSEQADRTKNNGNAPSVSSKSLAPSNDDLQAVQNKTPDLNGLFSNSTPESSEGVSSGVGTNYNKGGIQ